jgi:SAM-dependent methyltransferase
MGPDSTTTEVAPVPSTPSLSDTEPPPPSRQGARDSSPGRRRGRTTLRIPDDEVTRPQLAGSDGARDSAPPPSVVPGVVVAPPPPAAEPAVVLMPTRIISINPAEGVPPEPLPEPPPLPVARVAPPPEDSWTPYQPTVVDDAPTDHKIEARAPMASDDLIPIDTDVPAATDSVPESLEPDDIQPANPTPVPPPPPLRAVAITEPEGEEVKFDDDAPTPAVPAVTYVDPPPPSSDSERRSDPGAEIAAEDLVAVEPLPPMRARLASTPPLVPTAAARKGAAQPLPPVKAPLVIVPPHVGVAPQSGEGSGLRRKGRLWWEDLFNDDYLRTCEKLTEEQIAREVDFVEDSLGIERGGAVLDLACGTGRHTIELARRGYEVVGFDLSLAMLARAGEDAQDHDAKVNFVQGDMREMTFEEQFDGVFCWNTSFGFFEEEKNALVIDHIHRSLRAGGLFLLDVINRDFLIRQSPSLAWFEGDGCVCMDEMSVDFITSRMKVKRTMMLDDGRSREIEYSLRVYSLHELGKILHDHGFKVCEVSGRVATPGVFFGNESPRTIILAEKR